MQAVRWDGPWLGHRARVDEDTFGPKRRGTSLWNSSPAGNVVAADCLGINGGKSAVSPVWFMRDAGYPLGKGKRLGDVE